MHRYDPDTDAWTEVRHLPTRRSHVETATLTHQGRLFILGGRNNSPDAVPRHLRRSLRYLPLRAYRKARRTLRPGLSANNGLNGVDHVTRYDPDTDRWEEAGRLPLRLYACAAAVVGGQLIVTNGGMNGWKDPCQKTFVADLGGA